MRIEIGCSRWSAAFVVLTACGGGEGLSSGAPARSAVIDGTAAPELFDFDERDANAIGAILTSTGGDDWENTCTGTLIAPDLVLTAAHCVQDDYGDGALPVDELAFAVGSDASDPIAAPSAAEVHIHPGYEPWAITAQNDVAVIRLEERVTGAAPLPVNCHALPRSIIGDWVQNVGFGDTGDPYASNTRRWWVAEAVTALSAFDFTVEGDGQAGVCSGDSGGPSLWIDGDGHLSVIGVLSWGDEACGNRDHFARVDDHCAFINTFLPATGAGAAPRGGCTIEGVAFDEPSLLRAFDFVHTMTCATCNEVLDSRTCEDAINRQSSCQSGSSCTGCSDGDTRDDGVSCSEMASYAYFGPSSARALFEHVRAADGTAGGDALIEGVALSGDEVRAILLLVNAASHAELDGDVGLDRRAANGIVESRPFATIDELAVVPYVGNGAMMALRDYVNAR